MKGKLIVHIHVPVLQSQCPQWIDTELLIDVSCNLID